MSNKRLIEVAFPLEQTSLDSVHEKNVRHGHISTLHIWPARRPLAAARAALIATLLPDPGDKIKRDEILKRLAGTVVKSLKKKKLPSGKIEEIEVREISNIKVVEMEDNNLTMIVLPIFSQACLVVKLEIHKADNNRQKGKILMPKCKFRSKKHTQEQHAKCN